jgi:hypothetical protein
MILFLSVRNSSIKKAIEADSIGWQISADSIRSEEMGKYFK